MTEVCKRMSQPELSRILNIPGELPRPAHSKPLLEVVESRHQEELLQEELGVQHSDVSRSANQGVGSVGQGVEHVVSDQSAVLGVHQRAEKVVDHFCVNRAWEEERWMRGGAKVQQWDLQKNTRECVLAPSPWQNI